MSTDDKTVVEWQLKYLTNKASDMAPNDLDWSIKLEASYKRKGFLSEREMEVLENIYTKY